jgi:hypothetical protein
MLVGERQTVIVTRFISPDESVEYLADHIVDETGRSTLERTGQHLLTSRIKAANERIAAARALFVAAEDEEIEGWLNWFVISGFIVEMDPKLRYPCMTAVVMDHMQVGIES